MAEKDDAQEKPNSLEGKEWMIKPCRFYLEEYKDCRSFRARIHQYFIYGENTDCTQWRRDYDSCVRWTNNNNLSSGKELVESETKRRLTRLKGHYDNNVWEKRTSPPEDWSKPLPDYMQKEYETTFLNIKSKELKGEIPPDILGEFGETTRLCVIL